MALLGRAVLGVWNEVDPAIEDSFNDWYVREHIPERLSVPGMRRGRRYRAWEGSPRYMALYEAAAMDVLATGAYRDQLANPTPWTRHVMAGFRIAQRGICDVVATAGAGVGGAMACVHFSAPDGFRGWLETQVAALPSRPGILAAHAWVGDRAEPASSTSALAKGAPAQAVEWVLAFEACDVADLDAARAAVLAADPRAAGATDIRPYPNYRLLYVMDGDR
jgi:hypothetical protein